MQPSHNFNVSVRHLPNDWELIGSSNVEIIGNRVADSLNSERPYHAARLNCQDGIQRFADKSMPNAHDVNMRRNLRSHAHHITGGNELGQEVIYRAAGLTRYTS